MEKKKERDEKKKAYENNHSCITLQVNGQEDNPCDSIRPYYKQYLHYPVSKINGVALKDVIINICSNIFLNVF